ncbi:uncharacterized protein LOC121467300 [Drosophila elegans]|uniref:uncharacterized protein LOC121467300 n=1 Tax=Drosophila elegans TaxID=30023 RepID=UPI001BC8385E|nr:uncharacterized protein LOC121467300 [Drosophila elegans]
MNKQEILALLVAELRAKLSELGLSTTGRKGELQNKLLAHYGLQTDENDEVAIEVDDDEDGSFTSVNSDNYQAGAGAGNGAHRENRIVSEQNSRIGNANTGRSWFTLKDVEGSVSQFSGTGSPDINQWIEELEECALTVEWSQSQVFIYAKQLLSGAAKLYVRSQRKIGNWGSLKAALLEEFGVKVTSAEVHRRLGKRQQKKTETLQEYLYALMELAKPIDLDDESLIEYFVDGIPDSKGNKALLYQAKKLKELKVQIEAYQKMRGSVKHVKYDSHFYKGEKETVKAVEKVRKCFNCGDESHIKKDCPKRDNKCFRCNQPGHRAAQCKVEIETKQEKATNLVQMEGRVKPTSTFTSSGLELKHVSFGKVTFKGLVDTGADLCLLRRNVFIRLGVENLTGGEKCLTGIGESQIVTFGSLTIPVQIDGINLNVEFHIISDEDMAFDAILGRTLLDSVDMKVTKDGTELVRRSDSRVGKGQKFEVREKEKNGSSCSELLNEFQSLCMMTMEQAESKLEVDILHLPHSQRGVVKRMIDEYKPIRNVHCPVEMKILLSDDLPVFQHPRRIAFSEQKVVDEQVQKWLEQRIIKPSTSEYASPIVLVAKKNGQKRLCCDYRKLNEKIVRDNFPMIQMDNVIEKLQGATIFTTLDLTNGYFHVPVEVGSQKYTSFVTQNGQYEFLYVPFGISNSPAVFTRFIMAVLRELIKNGDAVVYMDGIIIPSSDVVEGI